MRLAALLSLVAAPALADNTIIVQSTTSTQNSGLYDYLLPLFSDATGITAHVVAVGTGQALKNAENCDGDVLLVHAKPAEEAFVAAGFGKARFDVMYNDFIIVGPEADPAHIAGGQDAVAALTAIAADQALFASRGDDSGTNKAELALWAAAGIDAQAASGTWYKELGAGMGETLNAAVGMGAYTISDRATWASFGNKGDFAVDVEGDPALFNQYGVIVVDQTHCPMVNHAGAVAFQDWLLSDAGQTAIAAFRIDGAQVFYPNAN